MSLPRIGAVSYLNTKPLVHGIGDAASEFEVIYDLPSRLADRLQSGELDAALIPVIEAVSNPTYTIVSDAAIGCLGPVRSVKIVSRVAADEIRSIALDEGSRTSVALTKVILSERHGITPVCQTLPINDDWTQVETDAALIIGDRAMHPLINDANRQKGFQHEWDLGAVWNEWTGLPFVFAVWAAGPKSDHVRLNSVLSQCRDRGLEHLQTIAENEASKYHLSVSECYHYLAKHLHFHLGQQEKLGLNRFFEFASRLNLLSQDTSLQFHDCQSPG